MAEDGWVVEAAGAGEVTLLLEPELEEEGLLETAGVVLGDEAAV